MLEFKNIKIHTLTPVFIGDGSECDFSCCWVDTETGELVEFEPETLVGLLSSEEKLNLGEMDILSFMKMVYRLRPNGIRKKIPAELVRKYQNTLAERNPINKLEIKKTASDPNKHLPYIPGSSFKGALRTGYLAKLLQGQSPCRSQKIKEIEKSLLGSFETDVFSSLKVSDCYPVTSAQTRILFVDRVSKRPDVRTGKKKHMAVTVIEAICAGMVFEGNISLNKYSKLKRYFQNVEEVLKYVENYSFSLLEEKENGILYPSIIDIMEIKKSFSNKTYLCRLGGYIGAESHTIAGCRQIEIRSKRSKDIRPHSTRALFATENSVKTEKNNISFGWCLIEIEDDNTNAKNPVLENFIEEQNKILADFPTPFAKPKEAYFAPSSISFDRNKVYQGKVSKFSKKGAPIVCISGKELTVLDETDQNFELGQIISITSIQGTTCKVVK